jgi:hypothetical protein
MNTNVLVLDYNHINHSKVNQANDWIMAQGKDIDGNETVLMSVPLHDRTLDACLLYTSDAADDYMPV